MRELHYVKKYKGHHLSNGDFKDIFAWEKTTCEVEFVKLALSSPGFCVKLQTVYNYYCYPKRYIRANLKNILVKSRYFYPCKDKVTFYLDFNFASYFIDYDLEEQFEN